MIPHFQSQPASGIDVVVDAEGSYRVLHNGAVLLESAEAAPCGVQLAGNWCKCKPTAANSQTTKETGEGTDQCVLVLRNRTTKAGSDELGSYVRKELQWGVTESALLITAVRV